MEPSSVTVAMPVSDVPLAAGWYRRAFDLEGSIEPLEGLIEFEVVPGCWLQLYEGEPEACGHAFRMGVRDLRAEHARLESLGVEVGRMQVFEGVIELFDLRDPDGNELTLYRVLSA